MSDANDFLFGGGGKAAQFVDVGDAIEGTIESYDVVQQTSMEDNTPLTWPDGRPRMQLVVTLKTDLHDSDDDDGIRKVYAKGGNYEPAEGTGTSLKDAIRDAVKKSGATTFSEGGWLKVAMTGIGKKTNRGYSAPKLYRAQYKAPVASVAVDDLFDS